MPGERERYSVDFRAAVTRRRALQRSFVAVEFAALEWVDWFNTSRLFATKITENQTD